MKLVQDSFAKVGVYDITTGSYDLKQILAQFKSKFETDETLQVVNHITSLARKMGLHGKLVEKDFDDAHIACSVASKDNKILNYQRVVFLTNAEIVEQEMQAQVQKQAANIAAEVKRHARQVKRSQSLVLRLPVRLLARLPEEY